MEESESDVPLSSKLHIMITRRLALLRCYVPAASLDELYIPRASFPVCVWGSTGKAWKNDAACVIRAIHAGGGADRIASPRNVPERAGHCLDRAGPASWLRSRVVVLPPPSDRMRLVLE